MTRTLLCDLYAQKKRVKLFAKVVLDAPRISKDDINKNKFDVLLKNVTDTKGVELTDHVWASEKDLCPTDSFQNLSNYSIIEFVAKAEKYGKYKESDFGLTDIGKIKVIGQSDKESPIFDLLPVEPPICLITDHKLSSATIEPETIST